MISRLPVYISDVPDNIEDLLYRRTDLSTFLVHFTRGDNWLQAKENLLSILRSETIEARHPYGMAQKIDYRTLDGVATQRVVCFTDTPLEHCWMLVREIAGRGCKFQPYGVAFTKPFARSKGCNPVWYIDQTPGHDWVTKPVTELIERYIEASTADPARYPLDTMAILRMAPFFEQSGVGKDFAWEREWRHRGHFGFGGPENVMAVFAPEQEHPSLRKELDGWDEFWERRRVPLLDPKWGLEKMLVAMSGVRS